MTAPQNPRVTQAAEWLRAISTWLLETDNDMKLPNGILDVDPLDIADALEAAEAEVKAREAALVEALTVAANRLDLWHVSAIASGNEALRCKLANWCEEARAALTKEPDA